MIKRILFAVALAIGIYGFAGAQCIPDTTITDPGIYPDSATGLPPGVINMPYNEVIQVKVLTDTTVSGLTVLVTNITITQVSGLPPGISYSCNPTSCIFPGGSNGCITLSGTPTASGTFPMTVDLLIEGTLFGSPISQPSTVDYYNIFIAGTSGISEAINFGIVSNNPNPANDYTDLVFGTPAGGEFPLKIYDLIGKEVYSQVIRAMPGNNTVRIKTSQLTAGVYMLTLGNGSSVATRKFVVSRK
ncbi:MAG TPA: T9SS type A sorting domain-containing protein [Bacteroidia bacterium]|nr:T9SS type A sorting domain-containing protein [Bacteroidia bacterium]